MHTAYKKRIEAYRRAGGPQVKCHWSEQQDSGAQPPPPQRPSQGWLVLETLGWTPGRMRHNGKAFFSSISLPCQA